MIFHDREDLLHGEEGGYEAVSRRSEQQDTEGWKAEVEGGQTSLYEPCVFCSSVFSVRKKNVFEIRWGVFSLTELTDLTEPFAHCFEPIREWPLPQPLPRREGRDMWGYPYKTAIKGHNKTYILFIGVSRWLRPFPSGEGKGEGPLSLSCFLFSFSHRVTQKNRAYRVAQRH